MHRSSTRSLVVVPACLLLGLLVSTAGSASEGADLVDVSQPIVNGSPTAAWPTVAALLSAGDGAQSCSGTVIGPRTILTAAHCVCLADFGGAQECDANPGLVTKPLVFVPSAGTFEVQSVHYHPNYGRGESDIAILELKQAIQGISPTPINSTRKPAPGSRGTIVGYGLATQAGSNSGIKRAGQITVGNCANDPEAGPNEICWTYRTNGADANTCSGDSGGPLFLDFGQGPVVAGVTSRGADPCDSTGGSVDTSVFFHRNWIQNVAGAELGTDNCSNQQPCVGSGQVDVTGTTQSLGGGGQRTHNISVPMGTKSLRVSLSMFDSADFDLFVDGGGGGCDSEQGGQFDTCVVNNPAAGTWRATVETFSGSGQYQLIATAFRSGGGGGPGPGPGVCTANATTLCLPGADSNKQFAVTLMLNDSRAPRPQGQTIPLSSLGVGSGGLFWVFGADNPEVLVKVLNVCAFSPSYWVYYSAGTDLGFELVVRDTVNNQTRRYTNPSGRLAAPVADLGAIPCQ